MFIDCYCGHSFSVLPRSGLGAFSEGYAKLTQAGLYLFSIQVELPSSLYPFPSHSSKFLRVFYFFFYCEDQDCLSFKNGLTNFDAEGPLRQFQSSESNLNHHAKCLTTRITSPISRDTLLFPHSLPVLIRAIIHARRTCIHSSRVQQNIIPNSKHNLPSN